jgi:hypothetical protein
LTVSRPTARSGREDLRAFEIHAVGRIKKITQPPFWESIGEPNAQRAYGYSSTR